MAYLGRQPAIGRYAKLDDFASSFNGSTTTFNLTSGGDAQVVQSEAQLIVSLGGIIQEPETDYTVSGSQISFTTAPISGDDFFAREPEASEQEADQAEGLEKDELLSK